MLSNLVGQVDGNSMLVLVAAIISTCVIITSLIVKRRSRLDIANEFYLAKIKQEGETAAAQYAAETNRAVQFKKIEQGLITSHREDDRGER